MSTVLRTCSCCGLEKPWDPDPFIRDSKASGFRGTRCWGCYLEAKLERSRRWCAENREVKRRWQAKNPEYNREAMRRRREAPEWDREAIKAIETQAAIQGLGTDHVFPIKAQCSKTGLRASGLHRSWNLQVLDHAANAAKGNRFDFEEEERRLTEKSRATIRASTLLATGALPRWSNAPFVLQRRS